MLRPFAALFARPCRGALGDAAGPAALPAPASSGRVAHDGADIWFATYGAGTPVILLHGGLANSEYWGNQVPALTAAGYRVIWSDGAIIGLVLAMKHPDRITLRSAFAHAGRRPLPHRHAGRHRRRRP